MPVALVAVIDRRVKSALIARRFVVAPFAAAEA
jgi:hypothetical protein